MDKLPLPSKVPLPFTEPVKAIFLAVANLTALSAVPEIEFLIVPSVLCIEEYPLGSDDDWPAESALCKVHKFPLLTLLPYAIT